MFVASRRRASRRCRRLRAPACRACRFPRRRTSTPDRWRARADGRCRVGLCQGQSERRLLQGHRHREAAQPEVARTWSSRSTCRWRGIAVCCRWAAAATTARWSPGSAGFTLQPANVDNPLKQGFVTLGTDGGHKSTAGFDGRFALDDEALRNFGKESVKKGHDVAIEIIKKAYGRAPERSYFIGGSQGGHEALDAAARYSRRLRRRRRALPGLQRHAASPGIAQCRPRGVRGRRRGVDQSGEDEADHRRRLREVRRPRRREGRHHQPRQGVQYRVRREDAALRQRN